MPRKQNGFGSATSFGFRKVNNRTNRGKVKGASGSYPSDRSFGSTVNRSVIEQYDLDSGWSRWRKGLEFYMRAAWNRLQRINPNYNPFDITSPKYVDFELNTKLYQGTSGEIDVKFDGYRFATTNSDTANHYVLKRTPVSPPSLGTALTVQNDQIVYSDNFANKEIYVNIATTSNSSLLRTMIGERITDGETEGSLKNVLTSQGRPTRYLGKSMRDSPTTVKVTVDKTALAATSAVQSANGDFQVLVGKLGYIKQFYVEQAINSSFTFSEASAYEQTEGNERFASVKVDLTNTGLEFDLLNTKQDFPPSLMDISSLSTIFSTSSAAYTIEGTYAIDKSLYQKHYGNKYLTADLIESEVDTATFIVNPFTILSVRELSSTVELTSIPFSSEIKLFAPLGSQSILVFAQNSFIKEVVDYDSKGNYNHDEKFDENGTALPLWRRIETDIDPWSTSVFTSGNALVPAVIYACSCPDHSHAQLRMPQSTESSENRKVNRQKKYPMPTAKGLNRFNEGALTEAGGLIQSWATDNYKSSYKQCKHSIAARFIDRIKTKEPDSYPSISTRLRFEEQLEKEIQDVGAEITLSYERSDLSMLEIVFSMAEGLNMDDAELAYVILNTEF